MDNLMELRELINPEQIIAMHYHPAMRSISFYMPVEHIEVYLEDRVISRNVGDYDFNLLRGWFDSIVPEQGMVRFGNVIVYPNWIESLSYAIGFTFLPVTSFKIRGTEIDLKNDPESSLAIADHFKDAIESISEHTRFGLETHTL